jgi:hypothetical protein
MRLRFFGAGHAARKETLKKIRFSEPPSTIKKHHLSALTPVFPGAVKRGKFIRAVEKRIGF